VRGGRWGLPSPPAQVYPPYTAAWFGFGLFAMAASTQAEASSAVILRVTLEIT